MNHQATVEAVPAELGVQMRLGHLGMLQGVIGRMAGSSAALKGLCTTVVAAVVALSDGDLCDRIHWLVPFVIVFALIDGAYLQVERRFRDFYEQVAARPLRDAVDMSMRPRPEGHGLLPFLKALLSWSVIGFYGVLAALLLAYGACA